MPPLSTSQPIRKRGSVNLTHYLQQATKAAKEGGEVLQNHWGRLCQIESKEDFTNLVTEADRESESVIISVLTDHFPEHSFLAEESGRQSVSEDFLWAIDPLDGTTNYIHCYPMAAVSIGLIYRGSPLLGVVYNPFTQELYQAARGLGATLNQQTIRVSTIKSLDQSLLATGFAYDRRRNPNTNYAEFCHLTQLTQGVRRAGSAALDLAYVAAGRLDGYWERGVQIWDIAAGAVIVEEAGGRISDYDTKSLNLETGRIVATNGHIHKSLCSELSKPGANT